MADTWPPTTAERAKCGAARESMALHSSSLKNPSISYTGGLSCTFTKPG